jgi:hypothetical protein
VRAGSAAALVLVLPGYALTMALFPQGTGTEKLLTTLGLSLASVALAGLALNWTPLALHARSWTVVLSSVTLGAGAVALRRQLRAFPVPVTWPRIGVPLRQVGLLGTALVVTVGAVAMATNGALQQRLLGQGASTAFDGEQNHSFAGRHDPSLPVTVPIAARLTQAAGLREARGAMGQLL